MRSIRTILVCVTMIPAFAATNAFVDAYNNDNGFGLTQQDAINYILFLAGAAAKHNMGIGLKNALEILPQVQDKVQFCVNEQCAQFDECNKYNDFLNSKPVFHIEYVDSIDSNTK